MKLLISFLLLLIPAFAFAELQNIENEVAHSSPFADILSVDVRTVGSQRISTVSTDNETIIKIDSLKKEVVEYLSIEDKKTGSLEVYDAPRLAHASERLQKRLSKGGSLDDGYGPLQSSSESSSSVTCSRGFGITNDGPFATTTYIHYFCDNGQTLVIEVLTVGSTSWISDIYWD